MKFWCKQEHLVTSVICCKFKKKISLKSDFIHFFHDFIHVYSPKERADSPQETKFWCQQNCLVTSFICCKLYIFFNDLIHVCSLRAGGGGGRQPPGDKILMSTERTYHFTHLLQVSKKSLWSLILYICFHDLIHVYSPGAGGIHPPGDKVFMSTETSCHFGHLLLVSNHSRQ